MALLTVEGRYKDGRIELRELPAGVNEAPVMVVFLPGGSATELARAPDEDTREARRQAAFAQMGQGIDLGGPPYPRGGDLHDRLIR